MTWLSPFVKLSPTCGQSHYTKTETCFQRRAVLLFVGRRGITSWGL